MEKKEAMKILKEFRDKSALFSVRTALDTVIPELAESEDERIIDAIKHGLKCLGWEHINGIRIVDIVAWLEKQGEQKETLCDKCKKEQPSHSCQDITALGRCALEKQDEQKQDANLQINPSEYINDIGGNGCYLKTIIQKPADKFKLKFKVGDWITNNCAVWYIENIHDGLYDLKGPNGGSIKDIGPYTIDKDFHLWSIKDAKDGDVLAYFNGITEIIMIFKSWFVEKRTAYTHFHVCDNIYRVNDFCICANDSHPATKEQRDILMKAIADAHYKWDVEKKELKED